ncbi:MULTISPECIES: hypothetical protein [unclassified Streptomyces]|uniref:hypothetical protein n=1 Tax=unclassified Streptomyces TaxID=2593676 RepID=UPI002E0F9D9E|nr:hypothetical protein OG452_25365 [Streptomyces sp. NBC_01197]WSS48896.1 hypothetical protein OG708_09705 [Streptomyces sp. NBC_01180]
MSITSSSEQALYDQALSTFGEEGLFDIAVLMGNSLTVSSVLDLFAVPAPE